MFTKSLSLASGRASAGRIAGRGALALVLGASLAMGAQLATPRRRQ